MNRFFVIAAVVGVLFLGGSAMKKRGLRNNNPGNLKISSNDWKGKVPKAQNTDGIFEQFVSPEYGIRALFIDLRSKLRRGVDTIEKVLKVYAPDTENNTAAYIAVVENMTGIPRNRKLSEADITRIIPAIIKVENGSQPYADSVLKAAYAMV